MSTINFTCPHCSHRMEFPAAVEGKQGKCPSCNIVVTVANNSLVDLASLQQQPIPKQPEPSPTGPVQQQSPIPQQVQPPTQDVPVQPVSRFSRDGISFDGKRVLKWNSAPVLVVCCIFLLAGLRWVVIPGVNVVIERIRIANDPFPDAEYECYKCYLGLPDWDLGTYTERDYECPHPHCSARFETYDQMRARQRRAIEDATFYYSGNYMPVKRK